MPPPVRTFDSHMTPIVNAALSQMFETIEGFSDEIQNNDSIVDLIGKVKNSLSDTVSTIDFSELSLSLHQVESCTIVDASFIAKAIQFQNAFLALEKTLEQILPTDNVDNSEIDIITGIETNQNDAFAIDGKIIVTINDYTESGITEMIIGSCVLTAKALLSLSEALLTFDFREHSNYAIIEKALIPVNEHGNEHEFVKSVLMYRMIELVAKGVSIHKKRVCPRFPDYLGKKDSWSCSNLYLQFAEITTILSEYNSQDLYLEKFLKLYHILENYMIRTIIIESSTNGFSVREFKRLYKEIEVNEKELLMKLIRKLFEIDFVPGTTLGQNIHNIFTDFQNKVNADHTKKNQIDIFLQKTKNGQFIISTNRVEFPTLYAKLLYDIRCSIVHNKETEYHLTSANQADFIDSGLADFYLQTMETIVFCSLFVFNRVVWYTENTLKLF